MFDSFRNRVAAARESDQLFFAALLPTEHIESKFGEASAILDSARVYTTAVTLWTYLTQVLSSDHGCVSAVCWEEPVLGTACAGDSLCWGQPVLGTACAGNRAGGAWQPVLGTELPGAWWVPGGQRRSGFMESKNWGFVESA